MWWLMGGINPADCVAAYAPRGAASQAASYVNLANPGTYDCGTTSAPGWNSDDGWVFTGTNQSIFNALIIPATQNWSVICEFSDLTNDGILFGCGNYGGKYFMIQPNNSDLFCRFLNGSGVGLSVPPRVTSGIVGMAGNKAYVNGVQVAGDIPDLSVAITNSLYIGCRNMGAQMDFVAVKMRRFAVYNVVLTPEQMLALAYGSDENLLWYGAVL